MIPENDWNINCCQNQDFMKSVKNPKFRVIAADVIPQGLSPIKTSGAEVWRGPNSDTDEGSDEGISRSYGQI